MGERKSDTHNYTLFHILNSINWNAYSMTSLQINIPVDVH